LTSVVPSKSVLTSNQLRVFAGVSLDWIQPESSQARLTRTVGPANPYAMLGQPQIWPRGYPLREVLDNNLNFSFPATDSTLSEQVHIPVQQGVADLDPDVDAIWRLKNPEKIGHVRFSASKLPLAFNQGSLSPYNSQNTAHYLSAFWALFIPASVNMRVCDIWRSYWAQPLLWHMQAHVSFASATVEQIRNSHDYMHDFMDELQMYLQSDTLVHLLQAWRCNLSSLPECMLQLAQEMVLQEMLPPKDFALMQSWIHDLESSGYVFPVTRQVSSIKPNGAKHFSHSNSWPDLELQLRTTSAFEDELQNILLTSLTFFWPLAHLHLVIVLDEENQEDRKFATELETKYSNTGMASFRVVLEPPAPYYSGKARTQWSNFWADNHTSATWIGFLDSDTLFTTVVHSRSLWEHGMPVVFGATGAPANEGWAPMPKGTQAILGKPEVFRAMNYFPVIIKAEHLKLARRHIAELHGTTFDQAFQTVFPVTPFGQFNTLMNYVWYFHHEEYSFYFQPTEPGWKGIHEGQVDDVSQILRWGDHLSPKVKVAVHWGYLGGKSNNVAEGNKLMAEGYCFSQGFALGSRICKSFDSSVLQQSLFVFEEISWAWHYGCMKAQVLHYNIVHSLQHEWPTAVLESFDMHQAL